MSTLKPLLELLSLHEGYRWPKMLLANLLCTEIITVQLLLPHQTGYVAA
jgi:hypothetical protein